jgi:hypothetical protein
MGIFIQILDVHHSTLLLYVIESFLFSNNLENLRSISISCSQKGIIKGCKASHILTLYNQVQLVSVIFG